MDYLPLSVCCFGFGAHGTVLWATWKKKIFILEVYSSFFTSTSLPFSFVFFNGLHYTYLPHSSPLFSLTRFFWRLNILYLTYSFSPEHISVDQKSQITMVTIKRPEKMYLLSLYSTYGRVTTNGPRKYIRITSRTSKGATNPHVIHFFPF